MTPYSMHVQRLQASDIELKNILSAKADHLVLTFIGYNCS